MVAEISNEPEGQKVASRLLGYWPVGLVLLLLGVFFATGSHRVFTLETLVEHRAAVRDLVSTHPLATRGIYVLIYAALVALSIPAAAFLSISGGFLFGWPLGGALAALGSTLGAVSIFLMARTSLGAPILQRAGPRIQKFAATFRADSFSYLLFLRLLPVMPFWITNLTAALFGMRLTTFVIATQIGVIPISYAFAIVGSGLDQSITAHEARLADCLAAGNAACTTRISPESLLTPQLMIALGLLGILALGPILMRKWQIRRRETRE